MSLLLRPSSTAWILPHSCFNDYALGNRLMEPFGIREVLLDRFTRSVTFSGSVDTPSCTVMLLAVTAPVFILYIIMLNPAFLQDAPFPLSAIKQFGDSFSAVDYQ